MGCLIKKEGGRRCVCDVTRGSACFLTTINKMVCFIRPGYIWIKCREVPRALERGVIFCASEMNACLIVAGLTSDGIILYAS